MKIILYNKKKANYKFQITVNMHTSTICIYIFNIYWNSLSLYLSVFMSLSVCPFVCVSVCQSVSLFVCWQFTLEWLKVESPTYIYIYIYISNQCNHGYVFI